MMIGSLFLEGWGWWAGDTTGSKVLLQKQPPEVFCKKRCSYRNFANFTGKHLWWSLFLIKLQVKTWNFMKKRLHYSCFSCFPVKFAKFLRTPFLTEHLRWLILHLRWLLLYFFKKAIKQLFRNLVMTSNNFFFSTHRLIYEKSNSLVYNFVVDCQVY